MNPFDSPSLSSSTAEGAAAAHNYPYHHHPPHQQHHQQLQQQQQQDQRDQQQHRDDVLPSRGAASSPVARAGGDSLAAAAAEAAHVGTAGTVTEREVYIRGDAGNFRNNPLAARLAEARRGNHHDLLSVRRGGGTGTWSARRYVSGVGAGAKLNSFDP